MSESKLPGKTSKVEQLERISISSAENSKQLAAVALKAHLNVYKTKDALIECGIKTVQVGATRGKIVEFDTQTQSELPPRDLHDGEDVPFDDYTVENLGHQTVNRIHPEFKTLSYQEKVAMVGLYPTLSSESTAFYYIAEVGDLVFTPPQEPQG